MAMFSVTPKWGGLLVLALVVAVASPRESWAQEPPPENVAFSEVVSVEWISIPVVVRTGGTYVSDLEQDSFQLLIDGRPVPIEGFEGGPEAPISLIFLQDLSGSMALQGKLERSREAVSYFLADANGDDQFAMASFAGSNIELVVPFTERKDSLVDAMSNWRGYGKTGIHDAVTWLPEFASEGRKNRRAAVLVTDGLDNASGIPADEARLIVAATEIPVYVLDLSELSLESPGAPLSPLLALAEVTGGRHLPVDPRGEGLEAACDRVARELRSQYVLGFATDPNAGKAIHQIEVRVTGGDQVLFRSEYYGASPYGTS